MFPLLKNTKLEQKSLVRSREIDESDEFSKKILYGIVVLFILLFGAYAVRDGLDLFDRGVEGSFASLVSLLVLFLLISLLCSIINFGRDIVEGKRETTSSQRFGLFIAAIGLLLFDCLFLFAIYREVESLALLVVSYGYFFWLSFVVTCIGSEMMLGLTKKLILSISRWIRQD